MQKIFNSLILSFVFVTGLFALAAAEEFTPGNIPVVSINIDETQGSIREMNESFDHSAECHGDVDILVPEGYISEYTGEAVSSVSGLTLEYIRGRGNTTWQGSEKKPYKLKFEEKQDILGMGKNKHWILLANYFDESLVRNRLVYNMATAYGLAYSPKCISVDVVMNGEYLGSYLLTEQVRIGKTRVDIDELTESDILEPEISGGYLLSRGMPLDETEGVITEHTSFLYEEPDFTGYDSREQKKYISDYFNELDEAIYGTDYKNQAGKGYADYLDVESFAKYWWMQIFFKNDDGYGSDSTFVYKPRNGKLYFGPVWDFDLAISAKFEKLEEDVLSGISAPSFSWADRLMTDPEYVELLKEEWKKFDLLLAEVTKKDGWLDRYYDELNESAGKDRELYADYYYDDGKTYKDRLEYIREWIDIRRDYINRNIDTLFNAYHNISFYDGDTLVATQSFNEENSQTVSAPETAEKEGLIFIGWYDEDGKKYSDYETLDRDIVFYAKYVSIDEATKYERVFLQEKEKWISLEYGGFTPSATMLPDDPEYKKVLWSSSDENVATVDDNGFVQPLKEGDVTVTVTLPSGEHGELLLHILSGETSDNYITSLTTEKSELSLVIGEYALNPYAVTAGLRDYYIEFSSSDEGIAVVDVNGVVRAAAPGSAVITLKDGLSGLECSYVINVTEEKEKEEPAEDKGKETEGSPSTGDDMDLSVTMILIVLSAAALLNTASKSKGKTE